MRILIMLLVVIATLQVSVPVYATEDVTALEESSETVIDDTSEESSEVPETSVDEVPEESSAEQEVSTETVVEDTLEESSNESVGGSASTSDDVVSEQSEVVEESAESTTVVVDDSASSEDVQLLLDKLEEVRFEIYKASLLISFSVFVLLLYLFFHFMFNRG